MSCENTKHEERTNNDEIINASAKCKNCTHSRVCTTFNMMVSTNEALMNTSHLKLTKNPINIDGVAQRCTEYSVPGGERYGKLFGKSDEELV